MGLLFGAVLYIAAECPDDAVNLDELIKTYANNASVYSFLESDDQETTETNFYDEILKGLKSSKNSESNPKKYFKWALALGKKRVAGIVSSQHRGAYDRAALTLGSIAESYIKQGQKGKANSIIREYYSEKFKRHSSFKKEVRAVVDRSILLSKAVKIT